MVGTHIILDMKRRERKKTHLSVVVLQILEMRREMHQHTSHLVKSLVSCPVQRGVAVNVALV